MAESTTTRFGLRRWSAGTDTPERIEFDTSFGALEENAAGWLPEDVAANRPSASAANARFLFRASDSGQLSYSTGSDWIDVPSDGDVSSEVNSAVSSHEGAGDPHPGYLLESAHTTAQHNALGIDHGSLASLGGDDHTLYPRVDGGRGFSGPVSGATPVSAAHLATKAYVDARVPVGVVSFHGGSTAPNGWLFCHGQAVSRTAYSALFALIGTTYGNGDGGTTFNVPDLRGRFPLGKADSGTGSTLGSTGGSLNHTHSNPSVNSVGDHAHGNPNVNSGGSHGHNDTFAVRGETSGDGSGPSAGASGTGHYHSLIGSVSSGGTHGHSMGSTHNAGGHGHSQGSTGGANPPYLVLQPIIRAL